MNLRPLGYEPSVLPTELPHYLKHLAAPTVAKAFLLIFSRLKENLRFAVARYRKMFQNPGGNPSFGAPTG